MRQRGFSLLEILVAFSILALSLGVLMQIFSGATRNADLSRDQGLATTLAQSLLAGLTAEPVLAAGEGQGEVGQAFRWRTRVAPFEDMAGDAPALAAPPLVELWRLSASVSWGEPGSAGERSLALSTLRLRAKAAQ